MLSNLIAKKSLIYKGKNKLLKIPVEKNKAFTHAIRCINATLVVKGLISNSLLP